MLRRSGDEVQSNQGRNRDRSRPGPVSIEIAITCGDGSATPARHPTPGSTPRLRLLFRFRALALEDFQPVLAWQHPSKGARIRIVFSWFFPSLAPPVCLANAVARSVTHSLPSPQIPSSGQHHVDGKESIGRSVGADRFAETPPPHHDQSVNKARQNSGHPEPAMQDAEYD